MNLNLHVIQDNAKLIHSLLSLGKFEEANAVKHDTNNMIQTMVRTNKVKYSRPWLEVRDLCRKVGIDTTELEIELSFSQVK